MDKQRFPHKIMVKKGTAPQEALDRIEKSKKGPMGKIKARLMGRGSVKKAADKLEREFPDFYGSKFYKGVKKTAWKADQRIAERKFRASEEKIEERLEKKAEEKEEDKAKKAEEKPKAAKVKGGGRGGGVGIDPEMLKLLLGLIAIMIILATIFSFF